MSPEQFERIETLLLEGNDLRRKAIALQEQSMQLQQSIVTDTRANIAKAGTVNDQALDLQKRARKVLKVVLGIIFLLVVYLSYLIFFKIRFS